MHATQVAREHDGRRDERKEKWTKLRADSEQPVRDVRTAALNGRKLTMMTQCAQRCSRDELVSPAGWYDGLITRQHAGMRELNRRRGKCRKDCIRAENDNRRDARVVGCCAVWRAERHELRKSSRCAYASTHIDHASMSVRPHARGYANPAKTG